MSDGITSYHRALCSCSRAEVELGCDLCRYCREDYEERQREREDTSQRVRDGEERPGPDWQAIP